MPDAAAREALDAAVVVVNNALGAKPRHTYRWGTGDRYEHRDDCIPCGISALRAALIAAAVPGVLGGPAQSSPPAAAPDGPPSGCGAGGDPTSGADAEAGARGGLSADPAPDYQSPAEGSSR